MFWIGCQKRVARLVATTWLITCILTLGCSRAAEESSRSPANPNSRDADATGASGDEPGDGSASPSTRSKPSIPVNVEPQTYETDANDLLAMRLDADRAEQGWIRLFDGYTLFGWEIATAANFRIEDQAIVVDAGQPGLLCTAVPWSDYRLQLSYRCDDPQTNSGVVLRSSIQPDDPATQCYEINIDDSSESFPTGSLTGRQKRQSSPPSQTEGRWRTMELEMVGGELTVQMDGEVVCDYADENPLPAGRIGLQFETGKIQFRDIQLQPIGLDSLIDETLSRWKQYPAMNGQFRFQDGSIVVDGGKTQLETDSSYGDFTLLAVYQLAAPDTNTGIFFRCIVGDEMMGYECQVNDAIEGANPLEPTDTGTGGIFRRQAARIVPAFSDRPNSLVLNVRGLQMAAWVNGLQVSQWYDDRKPNENPRRGSRTDPGSIMIQGHDPATQAVFKSFQIAP